MRSRASCNAFASLTAVIRYANPADKAEIYKGLNLVLTYQPEAQTVRAEAHVSLDSHGYCWCPRACAPETNACSPVNSQLGGGHDRATRHSLGSDAMD